MGGRALASGLSRVHADKTWFNYFMSPTSVFAVHKTRYAKVGKVGINNSA